MSVVSGPPPVIADTVPPDFTGMEPEVEPTPEPEVEPTPAAEPPTQTVDVEALRTQLRNEIFDEIRQQQAQQQRQQQQPQVPLDDDDLIAQAFEQFEPKRAVQMIRQQLRNEFAQTVGVQLAPVQQREVVAIVEQEIGQELTPEAKTYALTLAQNVDPNGLRQNKMAREMIANAVEAVNIRAKAKATSARPNRPEPAHGEPGIDISGNDVKQVNMERQRVRERHGLTKEQYPDLTARQIAEMSAGEL